VSCSGAVACPRGEALHIGRGVLSAGGNAVDAAVAMSFAQGVAEPYMGGIGGLGEIVIREPSGAVHVVDGAGRAPGGARSDMYALVGGGEGELYAWPRVRDDANARGAASVLAPRIVPALAAAHERFGMR
jgi:gamma-glutamyltranspeptidase/glutathione hydrolase